MLLTYANTFMIATRNPVIPQGGTTPQTKPPRPR